MKRATGFIQLRAWGCHFDICVPDDYTDEQIEEAAKEVCKYRIVYDIEKPTEDLTEIINGSEKQKFIKRIGNNDILDFSSYVRTVE